MTDGHRALERFITAFLALPHTATLNTEASPAGHGPARVALHFALVNSRAWRDKRQNTIGFFSAVGTSPGKLGEL